MLVSTTKLKYEKSKNKGGVLGGLGYLGGSLAAGVAGVGEGVIDAVLALGADLTGNHDFAEYVFKNNVIGDWHEDISDDYNPTGVMQFFGDVMSGLGQSSYFLIPYAGAPLFFTGVMSQGISGAAEKTGDVGIKEAAYGLTTGAVEGGLEMVFGGMAKAGKTLLSGITKGAIKSTTKSAVRKGVVGQLLSGAASEFLEESASEVIDTYLQRLYKIDPNKELSMKDVLYSGLVGAVSGGVTAGVTSGLNAATNRARGEKIIKNGNAQTVVNTASYVADKLAASGTDFKNTSEWVRILRGEVDAYNKLVEQGKGESASAHTILGEMQASLFFAETQAINAGITERIKTASEEDRAAMAEYINRNFDKKQRQKDFTAEDIAADTNEVAKQLAIMQMVGSPFFNYDAAMADQAQESAVENVIAKEQSKGATRVQSEAPTAQAAPVDAAFERAAAEGMQNAEGRMQSEAPVVEDFAAAEVGEVKHDLADDVADIESSATEIDDDIERIRGDVKKAVSGIKVDGKLYELSDKHINNIANGVQKYIRQGMSESDAIAKAVRTRLVDIKSMGEESGVKHELGKATLTKVRGAVINAYRGGMQSRTVEDTAKTAQEARKTSEGTEARKGAENVAEAKEGGKAAQKSSESKNKSAKTTPSTAEAVPLPQKGGKAEPKVSEAKESLTDAQRAERAKKRAEAWIEWEKKTAPTAQELNTAREYVKGFDNLNNRRRLAILRTIRSAEGVDAQTVKGIANLMAVIPGSDLEVRFSDGIGPKGLITKIGNKSVIVIDSSTDRKTTIKGTIAHELTHYLENKAGYEQFAKFVREHAKAEKVAEIEEQYNGFYEKKYTAEERKKAGLAADAEATEEIKKKVAERMATEEYKKLIDSEVTAKLVGKALNNERFLKRYADRDKKFIQKAFEWLKTLVKRSKTEGNEEISEVADEMAHKLIVLLQSDKTTGESKSGTKYLFVGEKAKTADKLKLATAKEMLESGADSETVRRETGWFKGYDGKWRFEIDDSNMKIIKEYLLLKEGRYTLDEVISHDGLFEAYPELAKMEVVVQRGGFAKGAVGAYIADQDILALNNAIYLRDEDVKKVIVHEIQHKIQRLEGFARGSSPDYWEKKGITEEEYNDFVAKTERELAKAKKKLSDSDREKLNEYYALGKKQDELYSKLDFKKIFDEKENAKMQAIIDQISPIEKRHDELYDYLYHQPWFARINDLYHQTEIGDELNTVFYKNTAGEIEARNAAERINLSKEERKNTRPDVDRDDVVFAESSDKNLTIEITENGNPVVVVRDDITKYASNDRDLVVLVKQSIGKFPYVALGKQKIKFTYDTKSEVTFSKYTKWIRRHTPSVYKDKMRLFNHPSEIVLAATNYINEGLSHPRTDNIVDFARGELLVDVLGTKYSAEVVIGFTKSGECVLHDVVAMTPTSFKYKTRDALSVISQSNEHPQKRSSLNNSIPQNSDLSTPFEKKYDLADDVAEEKAGKKAEKSSERGTNARKSATVVSEYAKRYAREFGLGNEASRKVAAELEAIENAFVKGGDNYTEEYRKHVSKIWQIVTKEGSFDVAADDDVYGEFSKYMFRKKFRVDKRFREKMGHEWKDIYKALRGRIAADANTKYSHIDVFYAGLSEQFPGLFPEDIVNIHDQLNRIAEVIAESKETPTTAFAFDQLPYNMQSVINSDIIDLANSYVTRIESNRDIISQLQSANDELRKEIKKHRSIREQIARDNAKAAKDARAEVFDKKDVAIAVSSIEGWTKEEISNLGFGRDVSVKGMNKAKREAMISQIYIALHEMSAKGQSGPGSVAVKAFATEIASEYIDSAQVVGEDGKSYHFADIYDETTVSGFKQELADLLYGEFSNMGKATDNAEFLQIIRTQNEAFRRERLNEAMLSKDAKNVAYQALKLRDIAATQKREPATEGIQRITKMLGAVVDPKGNIRVSMIDKAMGEASLFLEGESMKSQSESDQVPKEAKINDQDLSANISDTVKFKVDEFVRLRKGHEGKALSAEEMRLASEILQGMRMTIERYNKEFINGHWVDVETIASETVADLLDFVVKDKEYKTKIGKILGGKLGKTIDQGYFYYILSPETVIEALEGYKQGGLLKSLYHSVRVAKQKAEHRAVQMKKPFAEFLDDKKHEWEAKKDQGGKEGRKYSYRDKLNVRMINVNGTNITLGEAIYLYMLTKREHAWAGLQNEGFITYDENNQQRTRIKIEEIATTRDFIYNQLDKTDLEFLRMAEEFFNKTATKVKEDADMEIFGFTNTQDSYYVPIIRDRYSRMGGVTDARQSIGSIITVYNKSFNQNLVQNAKALEGKNVMSIINDHADGLADYAELYLPLKAFDRVYNKVVPTSEGNRSLREILNTKVWNGTEDYFKNLFSDIQGQRKDKPENFDKIVGKLRSAWVNSVLGANLKVVATQTTSLGAATQVIEPKYIMPAVRITTPGLKVDELRARAYKYSDIIEARSFDMGALRAQGNIEKVSKIGEYSGWAIGWMDERVCLAIFHAAELKVQDTKGYAIGTEENARLAAKIADEAIYTTQAMSTASERSAMQRSKSEIMKLFAMFTSDSVKNLSHLYGNVMKYAAHSQRVKAGDTSYKAALETDKKEIKRSMRTLAITGIMLGLITQGFKYLFAKEEEEPEDKAWDFAIDVASSTLNILPIASDIIDKFVFNYDISMNVLDVINDSIETVAKGFKTAGKSMSGEYVSTSEAVSVTYDVIKSAAEMFGIPVSPVERTITGLMRRFTPSAIYGWDAAFSNPSYTADLKDAVENGDEALAEHILSQLYKSEVNGTYTSTELEEVARLYKAGNENVIPQKIGKEINGVTLNAAQRKQFTKTYSQASGEVNKLISSSYYSALDDEQRAKAIKNVYAMYYGRAANEIVGKEMTTAVAYSYLTDNYAALFASQAYKSGLSEQVDLYGNKTTVREQFVDYTANLGLSDNDLLVISYANGVRDKETKTAFLQYLNAMQLSADVKKQIAERLGFEYRDGAVVEKSE